MEYTKAMMPKSQLEVLCERALNVVPRQRPVNFVKLCASNGGPANWTLREVDPRFDIDDVRRSYAVIRELQRRYQMVA